MTSILNIKYKKLNTQMKNKKYFWFLICVFNLWFLIFGFSGYAKEITILYTGDTHAMLYPCSCPHEPDGGIARRATLIKQLRKITPDLLLLDSGAFFAGGMFDEYTQDTQLDTQRSLANLKAMELMQYDALNVSSEEFNFGKNLLLEAIRKTDSAFISSNVLFNSLEGEGNLLAPYLIREVGGTKIGIIGAASLDVMRKTGGAVSVTDASEAVEVAVTELKKKKVDIIILLSQLGQSQDIELAKQVKGIDIVISGQSQSAEVPSKKRDLTLFVYPAWQGKKLGRLILNLKGNKIVNHKVELLRLSDKIADDPDILSILPQCFSDRDCKKTGMVGVCQEAGLLSARCLFSEPRKIELLVIRPKECRSCETDRVVKPLEKRFPGLKTSYLYYPEKEAAKLVKELELGELPVYLFGREIEKEKDFPQIRESMELKSGFYMLKPAVSGVSYFLNRKNLKGNFDLFISLYTENTQDLLKAVKDSNPSLHFLAVEQDGNFDASKGNLEVEEYLRAVCVQKYYPDLFWDYLSCRAKNIYSSWWEDCLNNQDINKVKACARSEEGKELLKKNIEINKELKIMFGPTYLLDNQEIFSSQGVPSKEELKKIIKK